MQHPFLLLTPSPNEEKYIVISKLLTSNLVIRVLLLVIIVCVWCLFDFIVF